MSMQERYRRGLEARGYKLVKATGKYLVFNKGNGGNNVYLGRAGAARIGQSTRASLPLSEAGKKIILSWAEEGGA